jgi:hypothetical protein
MQMADAADSSRDRRRPITTGGSGLDTDAYVGSGQAEADSRLILRVSIGVTLLAALAIAVHLVWPRLKIDAVTVALLVFGSLPWLPGIVQSISLPGGPSIDLRNDRARIIAREERQTTDAVRAVGTASDAGPSSERIREIEQQAERYETIRREMPSGPERTREMGKIAQRILSLLPVTGLDVMRELVSPRAGQRLTAYLSLTAKPEADHGEELIETLTEREGIPYNQSWALRALGRILDLNGSSWVSPRSVAMLTGMRDGLRPGSSRQLLLADTVDRLTRSARRKEGIESLRLCRGRLCASRSSSASFHVLQTPGIRRT